MQSATSSRSSSEGSYDAAPNPRSQLRELVTLSPYLTSIIAKDDLAMYLISESIRIAIRGDEKQNRDLDALAEFTDSAFNTLAFDIYGEDDYRARGQYETQDAHHLQYSNRTRTREQDKLRQVSPERFVRLLCVVQYEHARRYLHMNPLSYIRQQAPSIERITRGVETKDFIPFIRRLMSLIWVEEFQWSPDHSPMDSGLYMLYQLMLTAVSGDQKAKLYRHLLSLRGGEARIALTALQLLLDFSIHSTDATNRTALLKALTRLSRDSEIYPAVLEHRPVDDRSERCLGRGSYGEVYKAKHAGQLVALKVSVYGANSVKVFCKEAVMACNLSHENILPCYGVFQKDDRHILVSPFMERGTVSDYLKAKYPQITGPRFHLLSDIASGLAYLHRMNIIHGDLKGANILVSDTERACLADFGISSVSMDAIRHLKLTQPTTDYKGTLAWLAPEIFDPHANDSSGRRAISTKSDVYAFACVCYEIMTKKLPFHDVADLLFLVTLVPQGRRPSKPDLTDVAFTNLGLTEQLWQLMKSWWHEDPSRRPEADDIHKSTIFSGLIDNRPRYQARGEFTAAHIRQNMVVVSRRPLLNQSQ